MNGWDPSDQYFDHTAYLAALRRGGRPFMALTLTTNHKAPPAPPQHRSRRAQLSAP
jgi:hypothetical protein